MAPMALSDSKVNNDKSCSKTCLTNYEALKKQYDDLIFKLHETEFKAATYKRGLSTVEDQLVTFRKNEVLFSEEVAVLKREVGCKTYEFNMLKTEFEKVKQEKEGIDFKIEKFENASKDLDKLLESQITDKSKRGLGYHVVPPPYTLIYNAPPKLDLSNSGLEEFQQPEFEGYRPKDNKNVSIGAPIIEDWESDNDDKRKPKSKVEKKIGVSKTVSPTVSKIEFVRPKQQEKPVRKPVKYAEMYRSGPISLNTARQSYLDAVCCCSSRQVNTARSKAVVNVVRTNQGNPETKLEDLVRLNSPEDKEFIDATVLLLIKVELGLGVNDNEEKPCTDNAKITRKRSLPHVFTMSTNITDHPIISEISGTYFPEELPGIPSYSLRFIDQLQAPKHFSNNDFTIEVPSVSSERSRTFPRLLFSHTYGHYEFMVMPYWSSTKLQPEFYGLDEPIVHEFLDKVRPIEFIGEINTKIPSANFGDKVAFLVSHYFRQRNYYGSAKPYPSTKLMRKGPEVLYGTKSEENSFEELKQCLVSEPILTTLHLVSCGFQILYDAFKISTNLGKANVVAEVFELEVGMIDGIKVEEEIIRLTKLCLPEILHFRESLMTEAHCSHIFDSSRKVLQKAWGTRLKIRTDFHPEPDDSRSKKLRNAQTRQKITPTDHSVAEALEFSRVNMFLENIHLHVESGVLVSRASLCQRFHRTSLRLLESRCEVPIVWRYHPQLSHVTQSVSCIITHSYNIILFTISLSIDSDPEDLSYTEEP
ncbi:hypothetical protein Tco_1182386 [Tanacetum coccineum]